MLTAGRPGGTVSPARYNVFAPRRWTHGDDSQKVRSVLSFAAIFDFSRILGIWGGGLSKFNGEDAVDIKVR